MKITGTVEAVGTQFNGSLKVAGKYYNFPKKYDDRKDFKVGDSVEVTLKEWEFNGKSGFNIKSVTVLGTASVTQEPTPKAETKKPVASEAVNAAPPIRDFQKEARGKTLCQYIQAQLSNPGVDVNDTDAVFERAKMLMEKTFEF